jgi:GNAT superfamily N-acetyltransferase
VTAVLLSLVVGDRVVLRTRLPDGSATDVLGWVGSIGPDAVVVQGLEQTVTVERARVVAARRLPAAVGGPGPGRTSAEQLERLAMPGWLLDSQAVGQWTLRAAQGFTRRANSCLAVGEPGLQPAAAAERIMGYAIDHQIPPLAQVVLGSPAEDRLRALGWEQKGGRRDVLAGRLGDLLGQQRADAAVPVTDDLEEPWWQAYRSGWPTTAPADAVRGVLTSSLAGFARVDEGSRVVAIGRGFVHEGWLGVGPVWTAPERRRRGLATRVVRALGHWGARKGARNVLVHVAGQGAAGQAGRRLGLVEHHGYVFLAPARRS